MAAYGGLASGVAGGATTTIDTGNLAVTGSNLCLVMGCWEDSNGNPTMTLTWDPAGDNDAMTGTLGPLSAGNYTDGAFGWLDDPDALTVPGRATYSASINTGGCFAAFFTAAGNVVSGDSATNSDNTNPTSSTITAGNVVTGDMVIDYVCAGDQGAPVTWSAGTNQTPRLDESDGSYNSSAVSTQPGSAGGEMVQTPSSAAYYGLVHFALRIPDVGGGPSGRIMSSLTNSGGLVGSGGIAGQGGGLAG